jgi:hypothetical protein
MQDQRWSGSELVTELRSFEKELRAAGLSENTVNTYVGRADTFVRWLRGEYNPTGPNSGSTKKPAVATTLRGQALLDELAQDLDADQLTRALADYAAVTAYDASLNRLYSVTGGSAPDLSFAAHRVGVIEWLRGWGCRHLRKVDTAKTSDALRAWWAKWGPALPAESVTITRLAPDDLDTIELAYEELRTCKAAARSLRNRDVDVQFGPTAAAKTLFVVRPQACLPWDDPIRFAFGWSEGDGSAYASFVARASKALGTLASRLNVEVEQLPGTLSRPHSTPAKIIDEYLWVKITRGL